MNKVKLVSILCTAFFSSATYSSPNLYGKLKLSLSYAEESNQINSVASRFGLKGDFNLNEKEKSKIFYQLELGVLPNDQRKSVSDDAGNSHSSESPITARDTYVGLKGSYGQFLIGRISTDYKKMATQYDPFFHTSAGVSHSGQSYGYSSFNLSRLDNSLLYKYKVESLEFSTLIVLDEENKSQNDFGIGAVYNYKSLFKVAGHYFKDKNKSHANEKEYLKFNFIYENKTFDLGVSLESVTTANLEDESAAYFATFVSYHLSEESRLSLGYGKENDYLVSGNYEKEGESLSLGYFKDVTKNIQFHALLSVVNFTKEYNKAKATQDRETLSCGAQLSF